MHPCELCRAFPFDEAYHLGNGEFQQDRYYHLDVIGHQMPFLDPAFVLLRQLAKQLTEVVPYLHI